MAFKTSVWPFARLEFLVDGKDIVLQLYTGKTNIRNRTQTALTNMAIKRMLQNKIKLQWPKNNFLQNKYANCNNNDKREQSTKD